jgi:hypothetical protein
MKTTLGRQEPINEPARVPTESVPEGSSKERRKQELINLGSSRPKVPKSIPLPAITTNDQHVSVLFSILQGLVCSYSSCKCQVADS